MPYLNEAYIPIVNRCCIYAASAAKGDCFRCEQCGEEYRKVDGKWIPVSDEQRVEVC